MELVDNSKLEELMRQNLTIEMQREFFEILKDSQLFLPVSYSENMFKGSENESAGDVFELEEDVGFNINYLTDTEGNNIVPLFTSAEILESTAESSAIVLYMSDLAGLLKQTDKYSLISVNPFTEFELTFPVEAFLNLFDEPSDEDDIFFETLNTILNILKEKSVELEEDYTFFVRGEDNFMMEDAVDGVFTPNIPFNASTKQDFMDEWKYLNILLMPRTKKIVYTGGVVDDDSYDIIIAPGSEFHFQKQLDEFTSVWKCGAQPFYDD